MVLSGKDFQRPNLRARTMQSTDNASEPLLVGWRCLNEYGNSACTNLSSLQANVKLLGQEMKDQIIKKEKQEHFTSTNYFRLTQAPPPGCLGILTQQFQKFLARWAELRVDGSGIIHRNGWSIGCKSEGQFKSLKCVNSFKLVRLRITLHNWKWVKIVPPFYDVTVEYTKLKNMKTVLGADNQLKKDDAKLEKAIESNPNTKISGISYIHILSVAFYDWTLLPLHSLSAGCWACVGGGDPW